MTIRNIGELIHGKRLYSTNSQAVIMQICGELRDRNIGALAVLDDGRLTGIISERDVITRVVAPGRDPQTTLVGAVMTESPVTVETGASLVDALERMLDGGFRHLPVTRGDDAVGMISMRDIPTENRFLYQRFMEAKQALPVLVD